MNLVESECEARGWALLKSGKYADAVKTFTEDLSTQLNSRSFIGRSQAFAGMKDFDLAIVDAKVSLEMNRSSTKAWYALAKANYGAHRYEHCLAACHDGLQLDPKDTKLQQTLELCKKRMSGEPEEEPARLHAAAGHDHSHSHGHGHNHGHEHEHGHSHEHEHGHSHQHGDHGDRHACSDHHDCHSSEHAAVRAEHDHEHAGHSIPEHKHAHSHADHSEGCISGHAHHDHHHSNDQHRHN